MDCIFCQIVEKKIPAEIVYEDEEILAFRDINPVAPVHILLIPKKHIADISEINADDVDLIGRLHLVAGQIAQDLGIMEDGFRLVTNCKEHGGQVVYHLHFHLIGGRKLGAFAG